MSTSTFLKITSTVFAIVLFAAGCNSSSTSGGSPSGNPQSEIPPSTMQPPGSSDSGIETVWSLDTGLTAVRINTDGENILRYGDRDSNSFKGRIVNENAELKYGGSSLFEKYLDVSVNTAPGTGNTLYRYVDNDSEDIYMDLVEANDGRIMLEVGGVSHSAIPSGHVRYSGSNYFHVHGNRNQNRWGEGRGIGNFVMNVNFTDGTGRIEGYTGSVAKTVNRRTLDGSRIYGDVGVSVVNGTFNGDNINVTNTDTLQDHSATMHGSFHGENAKALTGLYWDSSNGHNFFGSIAGVRNLPARGLDYVRIFADQYNFVQVKANGKAMLRYGHDSETTPNRRIVLKNIEKGRETVESKELESKEKIGEIVRGEVELGESKPANSLSLLTDEKFGLFFDVIALPDDDSLLEVGGDVFSSVPKGSFTYSGINYFGTWGERLTNKWGIGDKLGKFMMTVDFDSGKGKISGGTTTTLKGTAADRLDGSVLKGEIDISAKSGEFSSSKLTVKNNETEEIFPAVVNGNFHGAGAGGVTGIYAERSGSPKFYGLIVGIQQPEDGGS